MIGMSSMRSPAVWPIDKITVPGDHVVAAQSDRLALVEVRQLFDSVAHVGEIFSSAVDQT